MGRLSYAGTADISDWLVGKGDTLELMTRVEAAREDAMLGMRLVDGIDDELARRAGVVAVLESLAEDGLVHLEGSRWSATQRGWLLGNEVFGRIWAGSEPKRA